MKRFAMLTALFLFVVEPGNAQYLFTIAELIEIAETRDKQSLDALMKSKKFAFHKKRTEKGETDYIYLDRNPSSSELIGKINVIVTPGIASNTIAFNTGAGSFEYHMENQVRQEGFTLERTKGDGDRKYSKAIGKKKWHLTVRPPKIEPRATVHAIYIYAMPYYEKQQATQPTESATIVTSDLPKTNTAFAIAQNQKETFDDFFHRFCTDPKFQRERIQESVINHEILWFRNYVNTGQIEDIRIKPQQWKHINFCEGRSEGPNAYDWIMRPSEPNARTRTLVQSGIGNNREIEFHFVYDDRYVIKKIAGLELPPCWILDKIREKIY